MSFWLFIIWPFRAIEKHRHTVRAERMTFLPCEFGVRSERVVDGVVGL